MENTSTRCSVCDGIFGLGGYNPICGGCNGNFITNMMSDDSLKEFMGIVGQKVAELERKVADLTLNNSSSGYSTSSQSWPPSPPSPSPPSPSPPSPPLSESPPSPLSESSSLSISPLSDSSSIGGRKSRRRKSKRRKSKRRKSKRKKGGKKRRTRRLSRKKGGNMPITMYDTMEKNTNTYVPSNVGKAMQPGWSSGHH